MADYSFASEINFVPTLSLTTSCLDYYDWEDAMEDFFWNRGLESRMKLFFARRTFSDDVQRWWIQLQQGCIDRGEEPCRTWNGMKSMLQRRFDLPIENHAHKITRAAGASKSNLVPTKSTMRSSF